MATPENSTNNNYYPQEIRRVKKINTNRINDDWAYLDESETPAHSSTDQIFNDTYKQSGIRSVKVTDQKKLNEQNKNSDNPQHNRPSIRYRRGNKKRFLESSSILHKASEIRKDITAKTTATRINLTSLHSTILLYLFVQIPFAILSLVTLASASGAEAVIESNFIFRAIAKVIDSATELIFGFKVSDVLLGLATFFAIIAFAVGMFSALVLYSRYTISFLHPLSGKHGGLKMGVLLLALIGYSMPFANFFPWVLLIMAVVWKYPR